MSTDTIVLHESRQGFSEDNRFYSVIASGWRNPLDRRRWYVLIHGEHKQWMGDNAHAVMDDFGNLKRVH